MKNVITIALTAMMLVSFSGGCSCADNPVGNGINVGTQCQMRTGEMLDADGFYELTEQSGRLYPGHRLCGQTACDRSYIETNGLYLNVEVQILMVETADGSWGPAYNWPVCYEIANTPEEERANSVP